MGGKRGQKKLKDAKPEQDEGKNGDQKVEQRGYRIPDLAATEKRKLAHRVYYSETNPVCSSPEDFEEMIKSLSTELPTSVRVNKSTGIFSSVIRKLTNMPPFPKSLPWGEGVFIWADADRLAIRKNEDYKSLRQYLIKEDIRGGVSRQEIASMIPPMYLPVQKNSRVVDLCAAPASKTSQLLEALFSAHLEGVDPSFTNSSKAWRSMVESHSVIIANDVDSRRATTMTHQLQRFGSPASMVSNIDASFFPKMLVETRQRVCFDLVLADVPCTGDGIIRKQGTSWTNWDTKGPIGIHQKQLQILQRALGLTNKGGTVVYSTCSLNPLEDEAVVAAALSKNGGFEICEPKPLANFKMRSGMKAWKVPSPTWPDDENGEDKWPSFGSHAETTSKYKEKLRPSLFPPISNNEGRVLHLENTRRLLPHDNDTGGFFVAVLKRSIEAPVVTVEEIDADHKKVVENEERRKQRKLDMKRQSEESKDQITSTNKNATDPDSVTSNPPVDLSKDKESLDKKEIVVRGAMTHSYASLADTSPSLQEEAQKIWDFYGLRGHDGLPKGDVRKSEDVKALSMENLVHRSHTDKRMYLVTTGVYETLFKTSTACPLKWMDVGVRVLEKIEGSMGNHIACKWRLTQEGIRAMCGFISKRLVVIASKEGALKLLECGQASVPYKEYSPDNDVILESCEEDGKVIPGGVCLLMPIFDDQEKPVNYFPMSGVLHAQKSISVFLDKDSRICFQQFF
eukprot:GHVP01014670.1.p1 GENE.GHVP01014670.1~~GHVP01014670.1.p1  ORF type:complete len:737 (+),score=143.09 GHVP01014670.1:3871-6081(+)